MAYYVLRGLREEPRDALRLADTVRVGGHQVGQAARVRGARRARAQHLGTCGCRLGALGLRALGRGAAKARRLLSGAVVVRAARGECAR